MHLLLSYRDTVFSVPERSNVLDYPLLHAKAQRFLSAKITPSLHVHKNVRPRVANNTFAEVLAADAES